MFSLSDIRDRLKERPPKLLELGQHAHAAVSLVVCHGGSGPEVLFIERSEHDQDPWSGHLGFPGGRVEATDRGTRDAAERETREELGLDLTGAEYLGRIDDLPGAHFPIVISCFVFGLRRRPVLVLAAEEIADAFWVPLEDLLDPRCHREKVFQLEGEDLHYPAIQVLGEGRPYLWGITYRLLSQFVEVLGRPCLPLRPFVLRTERSP